MYATWGRLIVAVAWLGQVTAAAVAESPAVELTPSQVWLSDLTAENVRVFKGTMGLKGAAGYKPEPPLVGGVTPQHSLIYHCPGGLEYDLGGKFKAFRSRVRLEDGFASANDVPVVFRVIGDGVTLWESGAISKARVQRCVVDVEGVKRLRLEAFVGPESDRNARGGAVWHEPTLDRQAATSTTILPLLKPADLVESQRDREAMSEVRAALDAEDFAKLEQLAQQARADRSVHASGSPLWNFYDGLHYPEPKDVATWNANLAHRERWLKAYPDSIAAATSWGEGWAQFSTYWDIRDNDSEPPPNQQAQKRFEMLTKSAKFLKAAGKLQPPDSHRCGILMLVSMELEVPREEMQAILDESLRINPNDFLAPEMMAIYLVRFGEPGEAAAFAKQMRQRIGGEAGRWLYARIALRLVNQLRRNLARSPNFDYDELRPQIIELVEQSPGHDRIANTACWLASDRQDLELAEALFDRFGDGEFEKSIWGTTSDRNRYRQWANPELPRGQELKTLRIVEDTQVALAFSVDGQYLLGENYQAALVYSMKTGELAYYRRPQDIDCMAVHPSGRYRLIGGHVDEKSLRGSSKAEAQPTENEFVWLETFDPQGLEPAELPILYLNQGRSGTDLPLSGPTKKVNDVAISPDGALLAAASEDSTATIWETRGARKKHVLNHGGAEVRAVAFSPDGKTLATATKQASVRLWNLETGQPQGQPLSAPGRGAANQLAFLSDGRLLHTINGGDMHIYDPKSGQKLVSQKAPQKIWCRALSLDGSLLGLGHGSGDVSIYRVDTLEPLHVYRGHWDGVRSMTVSPEGDAFVTASDDETIKFWDLRPWLTGEPAKR